MIGLQYRAICTEDDKNGLTTGEAKLGRHGLSSLCRQHPPIRAVGRDLPLHGYRRCAGREHDAPGNIGNRSLGCNWHTQTLSNEDYVRVSKTVSGCKFIDGGSCSLGKTEQRIAWHHSVGNCPIRTRCAVSGCRCTGRRQSWAGIRRTRDRERRTTTLSNDCRVRPIGDAAIERYEQNLRLRIITARNVAKYRRW